MSHILMGAPLILQARDRGITEQDVSLLPDVLKKLRMSVEHLEPLHQRQRRALTIKHGLVLLANACPRRRH